MPENLSDIIDRLKRSLRDQQVKSSDIRGSRLNPISTFFEKTLLKEVVEVDRFRSRFYEGAQILTKDSSEIQIKGAFLLDSAKVGFSVCG